MLDLRSEAQEANIRELDAVTEALGRTPRLARLLRYMGDKYFAGAEEELTEYNIATEVCGRSKTTFASGDDAIARVEVHRLRKRLRQFYDQEGRDHAVVINIPPGTYIPCFIRKMPVEIPATNGNGHQIVDGAPEMVPVPLPEPVPVSLPPAIHPRPDKFFRFGLWGALLLVVLVAGAFVARKYGAFRAARSAARQVNALAGPALPAAGTSSARIIAGYTGTPIRDLSGDLWSADRFFHGGGPWPRPAGFIGRTSDPLLFGHWRSGDFSYDIPLKPGLYELHLFFCATGDADATSLSTFNVFVNGHQLLRAFDVNSDALGDDIADEKIFRDVSPAADGLLHLNFNHVIGVPALNAIEIVPGLPHRQQPIRIVAQRTSFVDHSGNLWSPDNYYLNGILSSVHQTVTGTPDPDLFGAERFGHFTYAIPVDTRDRYTLVLHFAELYFGPGTRGGGGVGSRVFNVYCNGQTLLHDFDIYKEAGSLHVITKTFEHLKPSPQGKLNLTFEPIANNATISGIEVLDEAR